MTTHDKTHNLQSTSTTGPRKKDHRPSPLHLLPPSQSPQANPAHGYAPRNAASHKPARPQRTLTSIYGKVIPPLSPIRQLRLSRLAGHAGEQQHHFPECAPKHVYVFSVPRVSVGRERLTAGDRSRAVFVLVDFWTSCSIVDACLLLVLLLSPPSLLLRDI